MLVSLVFAGLCSLSQINFGVHAVSNVTVDDSDASIQYSSGWSISDASNSLNYGGYHHLTSQTTATASFTFTGVAIYFLAPKWPYLVAAQAAVDTGSPVLIDLQDYSRPTADGGPETVASDVVWGMTGLTSGSHTLKISFPSGKDWLVIDALMYTPPDPSSTSSSVTSTIGTTPTSSIDPSPSSTAKSHTLAIALGASLGIAALALLIVAIFLIRKRRQYPTSIAGTSYATSSTQPASYAAPTMTSHPSSRVTSAYMADPYAYSAVGGAQPPPGQNAWSPAPYGHPTAPYVPPAAAVYNPYENHNAEAPPMGAGGAYPTYSPHSEPVRTSFAGGNAGGQYENVLEYHPGIGNYTHERVSSLVGTSSLLSSPGVAGLGSGVQNAGGYPNEKAGYRPTGAPEARGPVAGGSSLPAGAAPAAKDTGFKNEKAGLSYPDQPPEYRRD